MASVWIGSWGFFAVDEVSASITHILETKKYSIIQLISPIDEPTRSNLDSNINREDIAVTFILRDQSLSYPIHHIVINFL